ncbi:MAG: YicC family protein [Oscillospiraceae bacterium]|nr:YicC family protein [Oscillospiraceae bacterium]MBR6835518.1 YicC family protein [Oscillospiraceae bacterium]MBR6925345.1 YicC family protein [Oscillospiraceae bacterium]
MIRSMTGFGRERMVLGGRDILVEIRSVNNRYNELSIRLSRAYLYLEEPLKKLVQEYISRGKTEVSVTITNISAPDTTIAVNTAVAKGYVDALRKANEELGLMDDLSLSRITHFQDIFTVVKAADDEDQMWNDVKTVAEAALKKFVSMRENEGARMKEDVLGRLAAIEQMVGVIEERAPETVAAYREKLFAKLSEVLADKAVDEQRILTEAAIYAEKIATDEETVRLRSHIEEFRAILEKEDIVGRKLDFLVQEMNREANTTGSKAQNIDITKTVIGIKSEIEKIREQIQNIE